MDLEHAKHIFEALYSDVNGYEISHKARRNMPFYDQAHTYGEVTIDEFYEMIKQVKPQSTDVFYDLGSGSGKAVIAASLIFPFKKCVGIEFIEDLANASQRVLYRYQTEHKAVFSHRPDHEVSFVHGDFVHTPWDDADVVFIHATCFYPELMASVERKLRQLKQGARVIVVTKPLEAEGYFHLIKQQEHAFSWGRSTVFFYERAE